MIQRLSFAAAGLLVGLVFAPKIGAVALPGTRPTDGWTQHSDVTNHFPRHPNEWAHHWCKRIDQRLTECQIYDSDSPNARLVAIEPIVSDARYRTFPASERRYWHWHKTSQARVRIPGASGMMIDRPGVLPRGTTHGKTILLWDPRVSVDPLGMPQIVRH